ncbi:MAG: LLM class flavin-dependent oxidoreductase [Proteobacteria bacterium]|nr:LLM class flavin-dependent oxidoreductase [Pseudomonadota bacterium]
MTDRRMRLGLSLRGLGYHIAAWRHPEVPSAGSLDFRYFLNSALAAERAKFDMIFFADGIGIRDKDRPPGALARSHKNAELEPITLLSALAPMTTHIGLVTTASTTYNEPFHIARKFASLDHISGGRAGWNIVTSWSDAEAQNFNRDSHLDYETRYERAAEFVEVVTGLWDSWEDDAFIRDKASGLFYHPEKLHVLNYKGKHFQVRGPLNSARTPQGRPILVQAGAHEAGREIAAQHADLIYSGDHEIGGARAYYADIKGRLARFGRAHGDLLILPALVPFVGRTRQEAQDKLDQLQALIDPLVGLSILSSMIGDLSVYPIDGPVPDIGDLAIASPGRLIVEQSRKRNLTIRQLYETFGAGFGMRSVVGTAEDIADDMEEWFTTGAADGFNICPSHLPHAIEDFAALVVPELQRRGLFRTEYEGRTLRENLGLPPQRNRHGSYGKAAE